MAAEPPAPPPELEPPSAPAPEPGGGAASPPEAPHAGAGRAAAAQPPPPLWGSVVAFAICAAIGAVPTLAAWFALARFGLAPDAIAFAVLSVFAVFHVGAILLLVPRLQVRGRATLRHTSLVAVLVWVLAIGATIIGARVVASSRAAMDTEATRVLVEKIDATLAGGGFHRIVLDRYVALTDVTAIGPHFRVVGGTQEVTFLASDDTGLTWRAVPIDRKWVSPRAVSFFDAKRGWIMLVSEEKPALLRTDDGGATWAPVAAPSMGWSLACKTADRCWMAGTDGTGKLSVHATSDGGTTWTGETSIDPPAAPLRFTEPTCTVLPGTGERVLCLAARADRDRSAGGFALLRTDVAGMGAWNEIAVGADVHRWKDVWVDASAGGARVLAAATTVRPGTPDPVAAGILARSEDGGATWTTSALGLPAGSAPADVDILSGDFFYAVADDRLMRSTDGGATFERELALDEYGAHGNLFLRKMEFETPDRGVIIKANGAMLIRAGMGTAGVGTALPSASEGK